MSDREPRSRYDGRPTVVVTPPGGPPRVMSAPRVAPESPIAGRHEVRAGQRLDLLAAALLGDSTGWWRLADANPWRDATRLESPGLIIGIPGG